MKFIPFKETTQIINGETYVLMQQTHQILRQRRLELGFTQAQVAEKAGILLRQYARIEGQEGAFRSSGARIFLSVCAVLKLNPYMFFPEIADNEKGSSTIAEKIAPSTAKNTAVEVIRYPAKPSRFIPLQEYMELMRHVPAGKVVTAKTVEAYFKKKYDVEVVVIEVQGSFLEEQNRSYPFWRELSASGQLYATTRFKSRDQQQKLLEKDGLDIVPCGARNASLKVKNYKDYLFDLNALLISSV